jgi:hypothetical protein
MTRDINNCSQFHLETLSTIYEYHQIRTRSYLKPTRDSLRMRPAYREGPRARSRTEMQTLQAHCYHPLLVDRGMEHVNHMNTVKKGGIVRASALEPVLFTISSQGQRPLSPESDHHPIQIVEVVS